MRRYFKGENQRAVWSFVCANALVFLWLYFDFAIDLDDLGKAGQKKAGLIAILGAAAPLLVAVLNGLISSSAKARLIFWRWNHVLPGHRAFSDLAPADPRIDLQVLTQKLGPLPSNPLEQNKLWYRLLKKHDGKDPVIADGHKAFLLTRDLATMSVLFAVIGVLTLPVSVSSMGAVAFVGVAILEYFILRFAARNYGERLVVNVLACELAGTSSSRSRKRSE